MQVTGAGHGIGKELALKYASLEATVVCWDLNQRENDETVEEIKQMGTAKAYGYKYVQPCIIMYTNKTTSSNQTSDTYNK